LWERPRLGLAIVGVMLVLVILEGAFRLWRDADRESSRLREELKPFVEPRITLAFQGGHINQFADGTGEGKYFTLKVGVTAPLRCRGYVREIVTNGAPVPVRAPIPLRWIRESESDLEIDLYPGLDRELTVIFAQSIDPPGVTLFSTDNYEGTGVPWRLAQGESVVTIVVTGAGAPSAELRLKVHAESDWRKLEVAVDDLTAEVPPLTPSKDPLPPRPLDMLAGATGATEIPKLEDSND
jgi:hypothetical protein